MADDDFTGSVLRFYDANGALLAELRFYPSERARGDFRGRSCFAGTAVRWGLSRSDGSIVLGSCLESFGYQIHMTMAAWHVDQMVQVAGEQDAAREAAPRAGDRLLVLGKTDHVPTVTWEEAEAWAGVGVRIPRAPSVAVYDVATEKRVGGPEPKRAIDLSPLANLAMAVAWGMALERVVTEWRAWHPAARVTWDLESVDEGRKDGRPTLRIGMTFWIDGWSSRWREWVSFGPASRLPVEETLGAVLSGPKTQAEREAIARWKGGASR